MTDSKLPHSARRIVAPASAALSSRSLPKPIRRFLETESAGAVFLLLAAATALSWANSPFNASYHAFWELEATFEWGGTEWALGIRHLVNEGLIALFFFVVGLEIKRELVAGELRTWRRAALPVLAAVAGMVVPALIYLAVNIGGPGTRGWGIAMATDIAFAVGVLALLGRRVPGNLKIFILTLAIVDDIGAIVVMAVAYATVTGLIPLAAAALALFVPARPREAGGSLAERAQHRLHPVTSFVVMPLFALANAGVTIQANSLAAPGAGQVFVGVVAGLVIGKVVGISALSLMAVRLRLVELPDDVSSRQLVGVASVAGIGFTVSLFVARLAFDTPELEAASTLGVLVASALASLIGFLILRGSPAVLRASRDARHVTRNT